MIGGMHYIFQLLSDEPDSVMMADGMHYIYISHIMVQFSTAANSCDARPGYQLAVASTVKTMEIMRNFSTSKLNVLLTIVSTKQMDKS